MSIKPAEDKKNKTFQLSIIFQLMVWGSISKIQLKLHKII